jgi:hypothetical protein
MQGFNDRLERRVGVLVTDDDGLDDFLDGFGLFDGVVGEQAVHRTVGQINAAVRQPADALRPID